MAMKKREGSLAYEGLLKTVGKGWCCLIIFVLIFTEASIIHFGVEARPQPANCIVVLGCGIYGRTASAFLIARVLLKKVGAGYELEILQSVLKELQILIVSKSKGLGAYTKIYFGQSISGYNVYVPSSRLLDARQVLDGI